MWCFLGAIATSQLYFVQELVAAFAFSAVKFVASALLSIAGLYVLQKTCKAAAARAIDSRRSAGPAYEPARREGFHDDESPGSTLQHRPRFLLFARESCRTTLEMENEIRKMPETEF
jgi:hypothetical protein